MTEAPRSTRRNGATAAVLQHMQSNPGKIITLDDLVNVSGGYKRTSITTAINNLIKSAPDRIRRRGYGRYEWLTYAPTRAPRSNRTATAPKAVTAAPKAAEPPTSAGLDRLYPESERIATEIGKVRWEEVDPTHPTHFADLRPGNVIMLEIISHSETGAMLARITNDPHPKNNGALVRIQPFEF